MSQEPKLLPFKALLVSKFRSPPLAPVHLAAGEKKGGWFGRGVMARPTGALFTSTHIPLVGSQLHSQSPTIRLGYMVCASRKKREGGRQTCGIVLATPELSDDIAAYCKVDILKSFVYLRP